MVVAQLRDTLFWIINSYSSNIFGRHPTPNVFGLLSLGQLSELALVVWIATSLVAYLSAWLPYVTDCRVVLKWMMLWQIPFVCMSKWVSKEAFRTSGMRPTILDILHKCVNGQYWNILFPDFSFVFFRISFVYFAAVFERLKFRK